jgi:hypothetical protein
MSPHRGNDTLGQSSNAADQSLFDAVPVLDCPDSIPHLGTHLILLDLRKDTLQHSLFVFVNHSVSHRYSKQEAQLPDIQCAVISEATNA